MQDHGFAAFLFEITLHEHFKSKRQMAAALGVELRTLQKNFQNLERQKGGILAFQNLVEYCCEQGLGIDAFYAAYRDFRCAAKKKEA